MADLKVEGTDVIVHLSALEALMAMRRDLRLPVGDVRMVHVEESPLVGLHQCRLPGVSWPGRFTVGSCHRDGRREFAVAYAHTPAVVLDAGGAGWDRIVVSHPDAVTIAAELAALLLGRGPGPKPGSRRAFPASLD